MRSVLITGTSSGFGLASAVELARRGWQVVATMRDLAKRARLDDAAKQAGVSARLSLVRLDVTDAPSLAGAVAEVLAQTNGQLDAVVHNAGVAVGGAFEELPEAELRRVMETNFFGVLGLTRALLPTFRAQRGGRILVVSSNSAYAGEPANSIYVASKWAVEGWAESIAFELGPFGIDVVLVEPGAYRTEIWDSSPRILPAGSPYWTWLKTFERTVDERVVAQARDPQEVARTIATALDARRPRFRYPVGPDAWLGFILRGILPARLRRAAITRYLSLPTTPG
ncbi:MAG: SDR family NAD(P)-dependent oxidoreductase [bacterium]